MEHSDCLSHCVLQIYLEFSSTFLASVENLCLFDELCFVMLMQLKGFTLCTIVDKCFTSLGNMVLYFEAKCLCYKILTDYGIQMQFYPPQLISEHVSHLLSGAVILMVVCIK